MHALSPRLYVCAFSIPLLSTPFHPSLPVPPFPHMPTHVPDARDLVPGMDDRGSLALRAGQDNVHKVARRRHGLDLLEIIHHHGCWLSSVRVYKGRQVGERKGWYIYISSVSSSPPLSRRRVWWWARRPWRRRNKPPAPAPSPAANEAPPVCYDAVVVVAVESFWPLWARICPLSSCPLLPPCFFSLDHLNPLLLRSSA